MDYSKDYNEFLQDKNSFFNTTLKASTSKDLTTLARERAYQHSYQFTAPNKTLIEEEFNQLFTSLKSNKKRSKEFWLYCYYCSILLQSYHEDYGQKGKANEYKKIRRQIWRHIKNKTPESTTKAEDGFFTWLGKKIAAEIGELATLPASMSQMRDKVGFFNLLRIYWFFCRSVLTNTFQMLSLFQMFPPEADVDVILESLKTGADALRGLSVGFFAVRFIMNALTLMLHAFLPRKGEDELKDWKKRLSLEIYKRHPDFINDSMWLVVNGLTNNILPWMHSKLNILTIPSAYAGPIVAAFMFADFLVILWRRRLAQQEYLTKKAQYEQELKACLEKLQDEHLGAKEKTFYDQQRCLLEDQIKELDINWQAKEATFLFNASAALLLTISFSGALFFTSFIMVTVCYLACMVAVAMYLSGGAYNDYKESQLHYQQALADGDGQAITLAYKRYQELRNEFIFTLAKNIIMPSLMITMFAVCWQAALVITVLYIGYELWRAYRKNQNKLAPAALPEILASDDDSDSDSDNDKDEKEEGASVTDDGSISDEEISSPNRWVLGGSSYA